MLVVPGRDGGFSGPCFTQQGCSSHGIGAGPGFTKSGGIKRAWAPGQQE